MSNNQKILSGKRIGIVGKGGSGKSTLAVLLSIALSECGYKVCVLDADSTNVGLSQALGFDSPPEPLLDYLGGMIFSGGTVTCPVDDPTPLTDADIELERLPEEFYKQNNKGITLLAAGKVGDLGPGAGCDGPVAKVARDLKILLKEEQPVTLIDFKAGFEDSARGAVTSLDWVIVVIDPTTAAIEMAVNMRDMIEQIKEDVLPATSHLESDELVYWANKIFTEATIKDVFFIFNQIQSIEMEEYLRDKLAEYDIQPLGVIYRDEAISNSWLKGAPLKSPRVTEEIKHVITKLEQFDKEQVVA